MSLQLVDGSAVAASSYAFATALFVLVIVERILHAAGLLLLRFTPATVTQRRRPQQELLCVLVQHLKNGKFSSSTVTATSSTLSSSLVLLNNELDRWISVLLVASLIYHYDCSAFTLLPLSAGNKSKAVRHGKGSSRISSSEHLLGYASMQMVRAGVTLLTTVCTAVLTALVNALSALSSYMVWAVGTTLVFLVLYIVQENYSNILVYAVNRGKQQSPVRRIISPPGGVCCRVGGDLLSVTIANVCGRRQLFSSEPKPPRGHGKGPVGVPP
jgi:hypothetical protein